MTINLLKVMKIDSADARSIDILRTFNNAVRKPTLFKSLFRVLLTWDSGLNGR